MKTLTIVALFLSCHFCYAEKSVILKQRDLPLIITNYAATFEPATTSQSFDPHPDQIRHAADFKNVSGKKIVAVQIGFALFDAFNSFMESLAGWGMDMIEKD